MRIVARYITKEIFWAFLVTTSILFLIVFSNRFAAYLAKAATGELPVTLVFQIVALYTPELLSYLIPLGLLIGLLFSFGRLYADNEMAVLFACGISLQYIIKLTLCFALIVALIVSFLTLWAVPQITAIREQVLSEGEAFGVMQSMLPQRFQTLSDGKLVFYLENTDSNKDTLKGIFIAERPTNIQDETETWTLITAESARLKRDEKTNHFDLVLKNGHRYQGLPGAADYKVIRFKEYGRGIPEDTSSPTESDVLRLKSTEYLLNSHDPEEAAEFQWRVSLPLSVLVLALIAVPLARVRPRHGRFAKFLPAIVIYIIYYNLFTVSRRWVAASVLPSFIGVWWVHGLFFMIGLVLVAKACGWRLRLKAGT
jgi:lipopolysaccharide export system permease protein